jgi:hypothetical protein
VSDRDDGLSPATRLVHRRRDTLDQLITQASVERNRGGVSDDTKLELIAHLQAYRRLLALYQDHDAAEWDSEHLDWIRDLDGETTPVDAHTRGWGGRAQQTTRERPVLLTVDLAQYLALFDALDAVARDLGFVDAPTDAEHVDEIDEDDLEALTWARGQTDPDAPHPSTFGPDNGGDAE